MSTNAITAAFLKAGGNQGDAGTKGLEWLATQQVEGENHASEAGALKDLKKVLEKELANGFAELSKLAGALGNGKQGLSVFGDLKCVGESTLIRDRLELRIWLGGLHHLNGALSTNNGTSFSGTAETMARRMVEGLVFEDLPGVRLQLTGERIAGRLQQMVYASLDVELKSGPDSISEDG